MNRNVKDVPIKANAVFAAAFLLELPAAALVCASSSPRTGRPPGMSEATSGNVNFPASRASAVQIGGCGPIVDAALADQVAQV